MNPSIPAAAFVNVVPSVLQAGAADLAMNAVFLDNSGDTSVPIGTLKQFGSAADVAAWYGSNSVEASLALDYFSGYNGATRIPSALYFAQYNTAAVGAYLRGETNTKTLTQLQALSGTITIAIDGDTVVSANINLSGATSFSNVAALIQAGLQTTGGIFSGTGSQAAGVLTIASTVSGHLKVGDTVTGAGVSGGTATVTSFGTYTVLAGTGTVNVSTSGSTSTDVVDVTSAATCTYDAQRGAFVIHSATTGVNSTISFPTTDSLTTGLGLTAAAGAVLSQGAAIAVPATLMDGIVGLSTDWATFMTVQDPDAGAAGGPIKLAFATWNAGQHDAYMFVAYDSDPVPANGTDGSSFGALVADLDGTFPVWSATQGPAVGAFICGITASINFSQPGGRTDFAYRASPIVVPDVTSLSVYNNLKGNGYNAYCDVATRTAQFQWLQPGSISGAWDWADSYVNQIFWNSRFQNDFAELLTQVPSIPYTQAGYNMIRESLSADIQAMGAFGAWRSGVELSGSQTVAVNTAAGLNIATILETQGWYLQVKDPGSSVRSSRGSPTTTFWYTDGQSIQQITMASIDIE